MVVLGITAQHDAGAALIVNGRLVSAVNEERMNRQKVYWGWPELSIREVLRIAGIAAADVDVVAVANTTNSGYKAEQWKGLYPNDLKRKTLIGLSRMGVAGWIGGTQTGVGAYRALQGRSARPLHTVRIRKALRVLGVTAPMSYVDHHASHLASAYYTSPWNECLSISIDGVGDGYCSRIAVCRDGKMDLVHSIPFYHTPGQYYGFVTGWAGFTPGKHEGKITGLAAYGDPDPARHIFAERITYSEQDFAFVNKGMWGWAEYERLCREMYRFPTEDVAAAVQAHLEELVVRYVRQAVAIYGQNRVALSGGIFANVKLNQRIQEIAGVREIYVHPNMGDGGLGVGAAYVEASRHSQVSPTPLNDVYIGTNLEDRDISKALIARGYETAPCPDVEIRIAELLAEGLVVARATGSMEYGPRALGNRSILYTATDPGVNSWLNERLNRTEFMPFAPVILADRAGAYYRGYPASDYTAQFMTLTYNVTERCRQEAPAVTHVDGTARPQVVTRDSNPSLYRILEAYERLTGYPQVINTSFNMHEEPIVRTADDAIRAFEQGRLDVLALGDHLVYNPTCVPSNNGVRMASTGLA